ncbi:MAG: SIMPL domain-containing protein [Gammaproteobacteria bacterium]|nr:SIMPL domain-containing protein [Gammaproteobacteria bacterium]
MNARACLILVCVVLGAGAAAADTPLPSVTVSGHGDVSTIPDRALLSLAATATAADPAQAQDQVNRVVRDFVGRARALGASERQIEATAISLQPQYDYANGSRRFVGYQATRPIELRIDNLSRLAAFLVAAGKAGINRVDAPQLESSQAEALRRQALAAAARDAQANAMTLAKALGVGLGPARVISSESRRPQPLVMMAPRATTADSNQGAGISLGLIHVDADVTVRFDLQPGGPCAILSNTLNHGMMSVFNSGVALNR